MRPPLRLVPYKTTALEVAKRLASSRTNLDPLQPWSEEVLVPSAGVAQAITAALLHHLPNGAAGLQIHTIDVFARRVVNAHGEFPRVASAEERRLAMRRALRAVGHPMMESRGAAGMLERSYRDVRDSGLTLAEFRSRTSRSRGLRNPERTRAMIEAWAEYERLVAILGGIDPADLLARATAIVRSGAALAPQLVAGFYDLTGAQRQLIDGLFAAGHVAAVWMPVGTARPFAFAQPLLRFFEERSATSIEAAAAEEPRSLVTPLDTREDELASVCAAVARLIGDGVAPADIGIVARSLEPYDERTLNRFAVANGFRTTISEESPLVAHRFGRVAATLLRLVEGGFHRSDVIELLRDGLRTRTRADADALDVATRKGRIAGGTSAELAAVRRRTPMIETYVAIVAELEELTALDGAALLSQLTSMLSIETDEDLRAAEEIDRIAALVTRAAVWGSPVDHASIADLLQRSTLSRANEASGPLVWAGDVMRFRGRSFRHLFVVRTQDELFPQRRVEDPLLPDSDRRLLALREIGDGLAEEDLLHQLLIAGTSSTIHFTWAATDGFGNPLRSSRYVRRLIDRGACEKLPEPRSDSAGASDVRLHRPLQLIARAGTDGVFDGRLHSIRDEIAKRLESVSPTQLEDFGECPQKFLLKHILGVEDLDAPDRELQINPRDKGTLDHRILERFYRSLTREELANASSMLPQLPEEIVERLEQEIDGAFDELEEEAPAFNGTVRAIERRATRRLLRDFIAADLADLQEQHLTPRHFEYRFGRKHREAADHEEPYVVAAGDVQLRVEGTVDRIDSDHERFRIVDYKSGKAMQHQNLAAKIDRGVRLQLALYAMAVAEFFSVDPAKVSATIKPLVVEGTNSAKFAFELAEKRETVLETLSIFARAILDGWFPAFPQHKDFDSCKYCPVKHSCRTRHDAEERYAILQHGDARTLLGGDERR